jgi:hypothetical protein
MADSVPDPFANKVYPRNLTARADQIVRGNSASTRPESGVDNCYPGLEIDQRNLDRRFFPGLRFAFHRGDGALLEACEAGFGDLSDKDLPLWLWTVVGFTTAEQQSPPVIGCNGLGGLDVWRRVHDLLPGRIAVILGPEPGFSAEASRAAFDDLVATFDDGQPRVRRGSDGLVLSVALVGERAAYLDEGGVLEEVFEPGELTSTLCAPWQYDFNDCGCFYWAASKPDVVTSVDGKHKYLNFQRSDRTTSPPADVPPADFESWAQVRRQQELGYSELIAGAWNELPIVLNDRESETFVPPPAPKVDELWDRDRVVRELTYLATVEHALCVEYLYSHYSVKAPMTLDSAADAGERARFAAAYEVFRVAIDEMHHMRWANEALALLQAPPSVGRASKLGRQLDQPFKLERLTPAQLDWYIDVEAPSQSINEGLDGMYVQLHVSIVRQPELFPEQERLVPLIKLIIDEGEEHYERFKAVKRHLAPMQVDEYLHPLAAASPGTSEARLAQLSDQNYAILIGLLQETFALGDLAAGLMIEQARRAMHNLHETNHFLAARGIAPPFTLPPDRPPVEPWTGGQPDAGARKAASDRLLQLSEESFASLEEALQGTEAPDELALVERQRPVLEELFAATQRIIQEA